ncbi:MAG: allophanate hydrolase [Verrucomicrobiota bacterium]|nr:allophanate hydrolase [Verrucomicrobiota bacterium]
MNARDKRVWISVADESFINAQRSELEIRAGGERLPLLGLTFAVKDNIDVEGFPTTAGCPDFSYNPTRDAMAVKLLKSAGAAVLGKTTMDQFATGLVGTRSPHGPCPNAFNPAYISGGSSSGSAVAVARGEVDFALGTDTAGSGRVPAAYNGLIGYKPTRGLISAIGVVPACRTLDCVSIFSKTVALASRVAEVVRTFDPQDPFARQYLPRPAAPVNFRFAVPDRLEFFGDVEAPKLFQAAIAKLEALGGEKVTINFAPFAEAATLLYKGPWVAERFAAVGDWIEQHPHSADPIVREIILGGKKPTAAEVFQSSYRLAEIKRDTEAVWRECHCMILPTVANSYRIEEISANPIELNSRLGTYNNFVNLLDLAAVTAPAGAWSCGVGFGINLIGPSFSDDALLSLAARFCGESIPSPVKSTHVSLAVVGAHLRGQPLHAQVVQLEARFLRQTQTAPRYRLYAIPNSIPPKPGMLRQKDGVPIEVEVYEMTPEAFGTFVAAIPPPLCIGSVELSDGTWVKGFLCEPAALEGALEISEFGGWRAWLQSQKSTLA